VTTIYTALHQITLLRAVHGQLCGILGRGQERAREAKRRRINLHGGTSDRDTTHHAEWARAQMWMEKVQERNQKMMAKLAASLDEDGDGVVEASELGALGCVLAACTPRVTSVRALSSLTPCG
jgi:hypothetical protein